MNVDLSLLTALDALLQTNSVTAAAGRLSSTQPSTSRALGRLRSMTGDAILVRSGRVMVPTPFAESIRDEVRSMVERAQAVLSPTRTVEPRELDRTFTVRMNAALSTSVLPVLVTVLQSEAPHVVVRVVDEVEGPGADPLTEQPDVAVDDKTPVARSMRHRRVGVDPLVSVSVEPASDLAAFARMPHVVVSRRGRLHGQIDDALAERSLARHVVCTVGSLEAAFALVRTSSFVTVAPRAAATAAQLPYMQLPFPTTPVPVVLSWHSRYDDDTSHRWFRMTLTRAIEDALTAPQHIRLAEE